MIMLNTAAVSENGSPLIGRSMNPNTTMTAEKAYPKVPSTFVFHNAIVISTRVKMNVRKKATEKM